MPSVPLRRVRAVEGLGRLFLYTLKAGPAGGRLPPSGPGSDTTITGAPGSPFTPRKPEQSRAMAGDVPGMVE
jgi:hypothetical protein